MTATPPPTFAEKVAELVGYGMTTEEAASKVREREAREVELAETTDPAVLLPAIRDGIGLRRAKVEGIFKTISTPPHYTMLTDRGPVPLGPSRVWATRPSEFAAAFLDHVHEMPALPSGQKRLDLLGMIARAAVPVSIGEEATDAGWTRAALRDYLNQRPPVDTIDEAVTSEYPFLDSDGRACINGRGFTRWLLLNWQERISAPELGRRLREVGCEPDKDNVTQGGNRTTFRYWRLPATLDD